MQVDLYNSYGLIGCNRKHRGLPIIGSGPLASAPVASAGNQNMFYMSTDFGLCKYVSVFKNEGTDWVNCGRPAHLMALLNPTIASTVRSVFKSISVASGYVWGLADSGAVIQNGLYTLLGVDGCGGAVGGSGLFANPRVTISSDYNAVTLLTDGASFAKISNGTLMGDVPKGTLTSSASLYIGSRTDGVSVNFEGFVAVVDFYSGFNPDGSCNGLTLVDRLDFNKWDGTGTIRFDSGHACTVADGTPFTAKSYACIPLILLQ